MDSAALNYRSSALFHDGSCILGGRSTHLVGDTCEIDCSDGRRLLEQEDRTTSQEECERGMHDAYERGNERGKLEMSNELHAFIRKTVQDPALLYEFEQHFGQPASP